MPPNKGLKPSAGVSSESEIDLIPRASGHSLPRDPRIKAPSESWTLGGDGGVAAAATGSGTPVPAGEKKEGFKEGFKGEK
jgi:hypothetical protein